MLIHTFLPFGLWKRLGERVAEARMLNSGVCGRADMRGEQTWCVLQRGCAKDTMLISQHVNICIGGETHIFMNMSVERKFSSIRLMTDII